MARCHTDAAFWVIVGSDFPIFRTISDFRKTHLPVMNALFVEMLRLCAEAGLVKANASRHKAMSYDRMTYEITSKRKKNVFRKKSQSYLSKLKRPMTLKTNRMTMIAAVKRSQPNWHVENHV